MSLAAFLEAVAQRSLAVCEELKAVPYLRFHSGGFGEACPQRADASLQLPPGKKKKNTQIGEGGAATVIVWKCQTPRVQRLTVRRMMMRAGHQSEGIQ